MISEAKPIITFIVIVCQEYLLSIKWNQQRSGLTSSCNALLQHSKTPCCHSSRYSLLWYILFIKSDRKWCIDLSRSLFLDFNYLVSDQWVSEGPCSQVLQSTLVDLWYFESIIIFRVKIDWNCNVVGLLHHHLWLQLVLALLGHHFPTSEATFILAKDHWWGFSTQYAHMVYIIN